MKAAAASPHRDRHVAAAMLGGVELGAGDDPAEAEALRIAEQAAVAPSTAHWGSASLSRAAQPRSGATGLLGLPGRPLPGPLQRAFEGPLGWSLADVRIHDDTRAEQAAAAVGARAFTLGSDIAFGRGEFVPDTAVGRRTLAHELMHVVQHARDGGTPVLRRIPAGDLPIGLDLANERMRQLDRERGAFEDLPAMDWEELKRQGFGYVIDQIRGFREAAFEPLRAAARERLHPILLTPVTLLIDLLEADVVVIADVLLFDISLAIGFVESAVETVVGAVDLFLKLCQFIGHAVLAMIYDVQNELSKLGLAEVPDDEMVRPLGEDVAAFEQLVTSLPQAVLAYLTDWRDRFLAAPHEERVVMAGNLVGGILLEMATWEVSAAKAGKLRLPPLTGLSEPELALAVAGGGSMRAGAGVLTSPAVEVAVGGPIGAGGAAVLAAAGRSQGPAKPDPLQKSPEEVAEAMRQELGDVDLAPLHARRDAALAKLADRGVDVEAARKQTEAVLSVVHDKEALVGAGEKLQALAQSVTEAEKATEVGRLAGLGVKDNSGALAAYVAAAKKWATGEGRGIAEVYKSGEHHYVVRTTSAGESLPAELIVPRQAVSGVTHDAFMEQVVQQGEVIIDYALLGEQHGALPHLLQEMAVDAALKEKGFAEGVVGYRKLLGELHAASKGPLPITFGTDSLDKASVGSELWLTTFDVLAGVGIAPEDLTPAFLKALGLVEGDL